MQRRLYQYGVIAKKRPEFCTAKISDNSITELNIHPACGMIKKYEKGE